MMETKLTVNNDCLGAPFTPGELLDLARAGLVYVDQHSESHDYVFVVLAQKSFDLARPCSAWRINSIGVKHAAFHGGPQMMQLGHLQELDFAPSHLRQAYMDNARERIFITLFESDGSLACGLGRSEKMAAQDAATRIGCIATRIDSAAHVKSLRAMQRALLKGDAIAVEKRQAQSTADLDFSHNFISDESHQAFRMLQSSDVVLPEVLDSNVCTDLFEPILLAGGLPRNRLVWVDWLGIGHALIQWRQSSSEMKKNNTCKDVPGTTRTFANAHEALVSVDSIAGISPALTGGTHGAVAAATASPFVVLKADTGSVPRSVRFGVRSSRQGYSKSVTHAGVGAAATATPVAPSLGAVQSDSNNFTSNIDRKTIPRSMRFR